VGGPPWESAPPPWNTYRIKAPPMNGGGPQLGPLLLGGPWKRSSPPLW